MTSLALQMLVYMLLATSLTQKFASISGQVQLMSFFTAFFFQGGSLVLQYALAAIFSGLVLGMGFYYDQVWPAESRGAAAPADEQTSLLGESG